MVIIRSLLLVVEVVVSLMLIGLILLQKSKGGGLGVAFGGGGEGSMFGSRTGNVLTKATIVLGLVFLVNTLILGIMFTRGVTDGPSAVERQLLSEQEQQVPAEAPPMQEDIDVQDDSMPLDDVPIEAPVLEPEIEEPQYPAPPDDIAEQ